MFSWIEWPQNHRWQSLCLLRPHGEPRVCSALVLGSVHPFCSALPGWPERIKLVPGDVLLSSSEHSALSQWALRSRDLNLVKRYLRNYILWVSTKWKVSSTRKQEKNLQQKSQGVALRMCVQYLPRSGSWRQPFRKFWCFWLEGLHSLGFFAVCWWVVCFFG